MSFVSAGRGSSSRGRGSSPFGAPAGPKTTRPSFAPRARGNNQVRFNAQTGAATSERGGKPSVRASHAPRGRGRGRGKPTPAPTPSPFAAPAQLQTPAPSSHVSTSSSFADRFQALKKRREQERTHAIAQGFLADPDKPRTLAEAITPVGTCPDMCPEFERLERIVQKDVWGPELDDQGAPHEQRMVKKFRRAAAGIDEQLPSDLRPPSTLKNTVDFLFNDKVANAESLGSVHHFVWDRTRAVRNDFSIQQITKPADVQIAIECYERIARFHILSLHQLAVPDKPYDKYDWYQEREQLDRTLLSLMQYYDDSRGRVECKNEAEFRAYLIIFQAQDPTPDLEERVNTWPISVKSDRRVKIALELNSAASNIVDPQGPLKPRAAYTVAREDWAQFFDLVRSNKVSYLMACVSEIYFKLVRRTALNAIWRGFKGHVFEFTLSLMTHVLGFDDTEQTETFCQHFGFVFKESNSGGENFLDLDSVKGKSFPSETPGLDHQTFSEALVETKRMGRNFSAVIGGYTVAEAQNSGLIDESFDSQMEDDMDDQAEDSQTEEDPDSLFIPEGPSKSPFGAAAAAAVSSSPFASPFASNKAPGEAQPSSFLAQLKPSVSGFGQPSTSTGFNFGKPSVSPTPPEASASAATSTFTSTFGQQPSSEGISSSSSPFSFAKPPIETETVTSTEPSSKPPANFFSFAKPAAVDDKTPLKSSPTQAVASGSTNSVSSLPSWGTPASTAGQQTASIAAPAPSLFQAPSQPKPSFSFSSTSETTVQPSQSSSATSKSPFSFPSITSDAGSSPKPTQQPAEPPQTPPSLFSKLSSIPSEAPAFSQAASSSTTIDGTPVVSTISASPSAPKPPQFGFSQPSQPKKPSPLSQSFSVEDKNESNIPKTTTASLFQPSTQLTSQTPVAPPPKPKKSKDEILEQLAREVVLDADRGLIRQFVEYHARQTVMGVYDELYMESIRELADTFRRETLSYRFGKRWREICWRRRLARQGRERRKRAKKDQSARELKRKLAAEKDAVDDFLKSTRSAVSLGASLQDSQASQTSRDDSRASVNEDTAAATSNLHGNKRLKSLDDIDLATPKRKQPAATPRSNFLGFSMLGSQNRPAISSTPSRSNYFRLKAMGINPGGDTQASQARKRLREDSEEAQAEVQPPNKKSQTPPSAIEARPTGSTRPSAPRNDVSRPLRSSITGTEPLSKARQDDEELFARARAARQAMAESSTWYRSEIQKDDARRKQEAVRSLTSPSMERARELARLRSANLGAASPDVPAYRLRESRFVPRAQYHTAIEKAKQNIQSRSRSPSQVSTPKASRSPSRSAGQGLMALSAAAATKPSSLPAQLDGQDTQATDSMTHFTALHKAPQDSAWQYAPTFFDESVDPALSEPDVNGHANGLESLAQGAINEYVDLESDNEAEDLPHVAHSDQSTFEVNDMVDTGAFAGDDEGDDSEEADDEGEGYLGGYAQNPEDFEDEEVYDEEDSEVEEEDDSEEELQDFDEQDEEDEEEEEEEEEEDMSVSNNIKAGTGTADDAFELSD